MTLPKSIAIIGASSNREKYGNKAVRAYLAEGYAVYPVNLNASEIEGIAAYESVRDLPPGIQTASIYLPPAETMRMLDSIAAYGFQVVFLNPGSADWPVIERAAALQINAVKACSIVAAGHTPSEFD